VNVPLGDKDHSVQVLYQYNLKTEGDLASAHTLYVVATIGKPRDKLWARLHPAPKPATVQPKPLPPQEALTGAEALDSLRKIEGITIEEGQAGVKITAAEVAVHFGSGSSYLPPEAIKVLAGIARFVKNYPNRPVSIEGHTDADPITGRLKLRYPDNAALSKARAEKVKEYFVATEKLPQQLFTTVGWGEKKPLVPNNTPENKSKNRRVVIIVKTQ
jgi:flagellar motor protein MotB